MSTVLPPTLTDDMDEKRVSAEEFEDAVEKADNRLVEDNIPEAQRKEEARIL
jgi:hypothetical protein